MPAGELAAAGNKTDARAAYTKSLNTNDVLRMRVAGRLEGEGAYDRIWALYEERGMNEKAYAYYARAVSKIFKGTRRMLYTPSGSQQLDGMIMHGAALAEKIGDKASPALLCKRGMKNAQKNS